MVVQVPPSAALFVDGANWIRAISPLGLVIDFDRLISRLEARTGLRIVERAYYMTYRNHADLERRTPFMMYLKHMGWQVHAIPSTHGISTSWRDKEVDIAIALDAYEEVRGGRHDALMIGSGDADFAALFRRIPSKVRGYSVGFRNHTGAVLSDVSNVIYVDDLGVVHPAKREAKAT